MDRYERMSLDQRTDRSAPWKLVNRADACLHRVELILERISRELED